MEKLDKITSLTSMREHDLQALERMKELERKFAPKMKCRHIDGKTVRWSLSRK